MGEQMSTRYEIGTHWGYTNTDVVFIHDDRILGSISFMNFVDRNFMKILDSILCVLSERELWNLVATYDLHASIRYEIYIDMCYILDIFILWWTWKYSKQL